MTPKTIHALEIVRSASPRGIRPHDFARLAWPDSPKWKTVYHVGYGATHGAAVWRSAGAYLGRLTIAGYLYRDRDYCYHLTTAGGKALAEAKAAA